MNCREVAAVLDLEDHARAPDLPHLRDHLASCHDCRSANPELAWLLEARDAVELPVSVPAFVRPGRSPVLTLPWAAAAALFVAATWFGWQALEGVRSHSQPGRQDAPPARTSEVADWGFLGGDLGTIVHGTVTISRGRRYQTVTFMEVLPTSATDSTPADHKAH